MVAVLLIFSDYSVAEIYKWVDGQGKVHFSDRQPGNYEALPVKLKINTYTSVSYDTSLFDSGKKVVMYSTSWCGYCKKARKYFETNSIPFTEYDIEKNATARSEYKKMGATGVPVIIVGTKRMNGFSVKGFEHIYR